MDFISRTEPAGESRQPAYTFIFQSERLLLRPTGHSAAVPLDTEIARLGLVPQHRLYLGCLQDGAAGPVDCFCGEIPPGTALPEGLIAEDLRAAHPLIGETLFGVAGRAVQIVAWDRTHQYCGQCGTPTETQAGERAKRCPRCGLVSYPRISPATIMAVVRRTPRGPELLLARNHRFAPGRYSVVAGFVEPGESLEECVQREVFEETGIRICNIRYFGSQPWPFPNSLMVGFTAEYAGGEIQLEASELAEAGWFRADALPNIPPRMTIARRLIDWFVDFARAPASGAGEA